VLSQQAPSSAPAATTTAEEGLPEVDLELSLVKKAMLRDALVEELKRLINEDGGLGGDFAGVASQCRAQECVRVLQLIRSQTIEIVEGVKQWRRSKFNMKLQFLYKGANFLLRIISELDFVDRHPKACSGMPTTLMIPVGWRCDDVWVCR
jgi:hypothetical protein